MYLIGIFASPIPYLAILGIYLSGFAYIKFWPAQAEEDLAVETVIAEAASLPSLAKKGEATLWVTDFHECHALPTDKIIAPLIEFPRERFQAFHAIFSHFCWPSEHRVRPPPVG